MEIFKISDKQNYIPINFLSGECSGLNRIGGRPPKLAKPKFIEPFTRYLLTLNLRDGICVSLFTSFDYETPSSSFDFFSNNYKLFKEDCPLVQFVVHSGENERDDHIDVDPIDWTGREPD